MSPTATRQRRLRLLPIIVGTVVDIAGTLVASALLVIVVIVLRGPAVLGDRPAMPLLAGWLFLGGAFTVLGGFVAGLMAKHREVMHGLGVAIVGSAMMPFSDLSDVPQWYPLAAVAASVLAGALGGWLARWARGGDAAAVESAAPSGESQAQVIV